MKVKDTLIKLSKMRKSRESKGLSQVQVAKRAKLSYTMTAYADQGNAVKPSVAEAIAKALGVQLASLRY